MMDDSNELELRVNGGIFTGWTAVSIRKSLDTMAAGFELQLTADEDLPDWRIPPGEECQIFMGKDAVLVGYVDDLSISYDAGSHALKASGRDRTGDLVDCSAPSKRYASLTLPELAQELAKPYGITVINQAKGKKFQRSAHSNQPGESVHRVLERRARQESLILLSNATGGLLLTQAGLGGDTGVTIEYGRDIKSANFQHASAELFSEIVVKGQSAGSGTFSLADTVQAKGSVQRSVEGSGIRRYRPLCIVAESQADSARCATRARWEAGVREAKSRSWDVTVAGWRDALGALWDINKFVHLKCPLLGVDEALLITGVDFNRDDSGTSTTLKLTKKDAYAELPAIPQPKKAVRH